MYLKYWARGGKVREGHFADLEDFNNYISPNSHIYYFDGENEDLETAIKDFGLETLKGYYYSNDDLVYMGETEKDRDAFILDALPLKNIIKDSTMIRALFASFLIFLGIANAKEVKFITADNAKEIESCEFFVQTDFIFGHKILCMNGYAYNRSNNDSIMPIFIEEEGRITITKCSCESNNKK